MIERDTTFLLDGKTTKLCAKTIVVDSRTETQSVIALMQKRKTKDRDDKDLKNGNGFVGNKLPFARGHVVALSLGGCNAAFNVVPQFQMWQANGPWRDMETDLEDFGDGKHVMLVEVAYERTGKVIDISPEDWYEDPFMDWTDPRIPTDFVVRACAVSDIFDEFGGVDKFFATAKDVDYDKALKKLKGNLKPVFTKSFGNGKKAEAIGFGSALGLPKIDREDRILNIATGFIQDACDEDDDLCPVTYLLRKGSLDAVRKHVGRVKGIRPNEAKGLQACPLALKAQKTTKPKIKKHYIDKIADPQGKKRAFSLFGIDDDSPRANKKKKTE